MAVEQDLNGENSNVKKNIWEKLNSFQQKLDDVHTSLIGSAIGQDGGIVLRVSKLEIELKCAFTQIGIERDKAKESAVYQKIIWGVTCALIGIISTAIVLHFTNQQTK